jgi:HPt (histidine-containing phosphotransfer) domain-containing protein
MTLAPVPASTVLDAAVMTAIRSLGEPGEPDVFAEVARLFIADVPVHLAALRAAVAAGNAESVGQIAHRIRGGALEIGALRVAPVCAAIELAGRTGSLGQAPAQLESLHDEFALASAALEQAIQ